MFEHLSRRLLPVVIGLILIVMAIIAWPSRVEAHGDVRVLITYFSDASLGTQAGERIYYCDGHLQQWGSVTNYFVREEFECPNP